jgi:hypothetical protein
MRKIEGLLLTIAVMVVLAFPARATLIDLGVVTRDPDQGIDWLDLTETVGLSVAEALALFPSWQVATGGQVDGGGGLAHTAFLVGYGDDKSHNIQLFFWVVRRICG